MSAADRLAAPYPIESNLFALFERQAIETPEALAIIGEHEQWTYAELLDASHRMSGSLRAQALQPGEPVGIHVHRSPRMVAALLGTLHAGGAYVPLDAEDPVDRNRRIVAGAGCALIVTDSPGDVAALAREGAAPRVVDVATLDGDGVRDRPPPAPGGARLAYVMHTSGSTGTPKGVEIEHRSLINLLCGARDLFDFTASDAFLATSTIGFDISVAELFLPLITGGRVVLRHRELWLRPRDLAAEIGEHGVTVVQTGPSAWSVAFAEVPEFPRVRVAISTAEALTAPVALRLRAIADQAWNLYGPTEATVWAAGRRIVEAADDVRNVGTPLPGYVLRILDLDDREVADGAEGELCLGGVGLARGYRSGTPDDRERFFVRDGTRLYRTGDLAFRTPDGGVACLGRADDQLKIRGVRIEPGEIESALRAHPAVHNAGVTWFENASGMRAVVAAIQYRIEYRIEHRSEAPEPQALRAWLETRVTAQMLPSRFLFYTSLPQTASGKIDRKCIRSDAMRAQPNDDAHATMSAVETQLAGIWMRILKVRAVHRSDHFFSIGGDSLAAVRMIASAEAAFGVPLTAQIAFEAPTLARMAAAIEVAIARGGAGATGFIFPLVEVPHGLPLFFHGVNLELAAHGRWQVDCSLYSISQWAQGSGFVDAASMEALADDHIAGIKAIQPHGPYRLAGFSFGGLAAYAMAQRLVDRGDEVELLYLLDPMMPLHYAVAGDDGAEPLERSGPWWWRLYERIRSRFYLVVSRGLVKEWVYYRLMHLHAKRPSAVSEMLLPKKRWPAFWFNARRLARDYVARPYPGRVVIRFSSTGATSRRDWRAADGKAAWRRLLGDAGDIQVLPGHHTEFWKSTLANVWMPELDGMIGRLDQRRVPGQPAWSAAQNG